MSSATRDRVLGHLNYVGMLQPAIHKETHAPAPDEITNEQYRAYTRPAHDIGGEHDVPIPWEEKEVAWCLDGRRKTSPSKCRCWTNSIFRIALLRTMVVNSSIDISRQAICHSYRTTRKN